MFEVLKKKNYYRNVLENEKQSTILKEKDFIKKYNGHS